MYQVSRKETRNDSAGTRQTGNSGNAAKPTRYHSLTAILFRIKQNTIPCHEILAMVKNSLKHLRVTADYSSEDDRHQGTAATTRQSEHCGLSQHRRCDQAFHSSSRFSPPDSQIVTGPVCWHLPPGRGNSVHLSALAVSLGRPNVWD